MSNGPTPRRGVAHPLARVALCSLAAALSSVLGAPSIARAQTVAQVIPMMGPCQSHLVSGLSAQLLRAHVCQFPDALVPIAHGNISMNAGVDAYGTPEMVAALYRAADGGRLHINSAFRTVVVQYAYDETDAAGTGDGCFDPATPGGSLHEYGNAVDLADAGSVAPRMRAAGFTWWGPDGIGPEWDYPHFSAGPERRGHGVLAFQRLWNLNHPEDRIAEDGAWGPATRARLDASPAGGFAIDGCAPPCDGTGDDDACGVALLLEQPDAYASPRSTDVDADGRADLCARGGSGVRCWTAGATGWAEAWPEIPWSDASGWDDVSNYATLRMGDVNGDGRADVCARANVDFLCALSNGSGFDAATPWLPAMSDENGWGNPQYYTTLRLADVNGDGRDDLCARDSAGFGCWLSDGAAFVERIDGPRWSDAAGFTLAKYYGTLRMGDVNGDRRADVCIRGGEGMQCVLAGATGFTTSITGPAWSDAAGFGGIEYWSTLRLADVTGDGLSDLCVRTSTDLRCAPATPSGFGETVVVGALSNENGWADISNYATLRVGDIDGDGADDLCLRGDSAMGCWAWDGTAFVQHDGPEWSDASGWGAARYYQTIRLADFDGDGLEDLCARAGVGWRCHRSQGDSFGDAVTLADLDDATGWSEPRYWSTILSAGSACRAEMEACNARDDDCDGMVDEHAVDEICNETDDDCDGTIDESIVCTGGRDGSVARADGGTGPGSELGSGCSCRAAGAPQGAPVGLVLLGLVVVGWRTRRRVRRGVAPARSGADARSHPGGLEDGWSR